MAPPAFPWPGSCRAALSLTFDDGLPSQLAAVSMLEEAGLQGTFYVNPRDDFRTALAPWRDVAARGHELGNHTVTHPCSGMFDFARQPGRRPLEEMDLHDIERNISLARRRLEILCPEQGAVSFAYPCYQAFVGRGAAHQSYVPIVLKHCAAARVRGERFNDPWHCDLHYLASAPCEGKSGTEMVDMIETCIQQGRWGILTFHGIDEGHLSITAGALQHLVAHLADRQTAIWIGTVCAVARHVRHARAHGGLPPKA